MNDVFCSPDVAIFVCKMLGENLLLAKWKISIRKSKKIHIPNMSLSCDIYRWQVYKKAITKFCYKDNFLYLSLFSNCAYFIAGCMRSLAFFSLPYFPSSKTALLTPFLQENRKIVLVAHFGFNVMLYILVVYSLSMFPSKESFKGSCPVVNFFEFFRQNPWVNFFAKRSQKTYLIFWFSTWEQQLAL